MPTTLLLIRHGKTLWNTQCRYCGFMDIELSDEGVKQARSLAGKLKGKEIHKLYSSDRLRALQTAAIIFKGRRPETLAALREMHFGVFEGLTHGEIMQAHTEIYKQWLNDPFSIDIPKGESVRDFKQRVVKSLENIVNSNPGKTIAAITHGGVISMFLTDILKTGNFWNHIPHSTSLTILDYNNGKPEIKLLNDISHLESNG